MPVQILDTSIFTTRNRVVYNRTIKVYQGIDNPLQVVISNQDQKPANVSAYTVQVDIQDYTNNVTVWSGNVDFTNGNIQRGQGWITVPAAVLANLEQRFYNLTTRTISSTDVQSPLYIDDNYGVPLNLQVLPGYLNT
jgi:hypothetical protein